MTVTISGVEVCKAVAEWLNKKENGFAVDPEDLNWTGNYGDENEVFEFNYNGDN